MKSSAVVFGVLFFPKLTVIPIVFLLMFLFLLILSCSVRITKMQEKSKGMKLKVWKSSSGSRKRL